MRIRIIRFDMVDIKDIETLCLQKCKQNVRFAVYRIGFAELFFEKSVEIHWEGSRNNSLCSIPVFIIIPGNDEL